MISDDDKFLVVKKKEGRGIMGGKWHLPGKTLEKRENHRKALVRGIRKETGIEVAVGEYITYHITSKGTKVEWYECHAYTRDITPGSDVGDGMWVDRDNVVSLCINVFYLWPEEVRGYFIK